MSASLENIWDEPISSSNAQPATPAPVEVVDSDDEGPSTTAKRRSSKLFLSSDSEGEPQPKSNQRPKPSRDLSPDIAAIFDDLEGPDDDDDGFQELAPALDIASLRKDADARAANTVQLKIKPIVERSATTGGDDDYGAAVGKKSQKSSGLTARRPIARLDETRLLGPEGFPLLVKRAKTFKPKGKGHEVRKPEICIRGS